MVAGSLHDVTRTVTGANPCDQCHIPHSAEGVFLFARTQNSGVVSNNDDEGTSSAIKPLCYSCHDGTGVKNGSGLETVFSTRYTSHRTQSATAVNSSGTAYGPGLDCDRCHDPHDDGNTSFLRHERLVQGNWVRVNAGGNFCGSCHIDKLAMTKNHPLGVVPGNEPFMSHPTLDTSWDPTAGDYSGSRLYDPTTHLQSTAANAAVACASCHTPHGAQPTTRGVTSDGLSVHSLNTMRTAPDPADPAAPFLCLNCH